MASLADITTDSGVPTLTYLDNPPDPLVEALDGYVSLDTVFDRFPEEVYDQSTDSHLYRFLQALCGEAGAGQLKQQAYIARLKYEGGLLTFKDIDTQYSETFRFPRLPDEQYPADFDPATDVLTQADWDTITNADDKYKNRIQLFMQATRLGNSPDGIALAAEAGCGIQCDVFENYRAYYDLLSDDPLGIEYQGVTNSIHEFVISPRLIDSNGDTDLSVSYTANIERSSIFTEGATWTINTSYTANVSVVKPTNWNGHFYLVTAQTGNSGVTEPTWPTDGTSVVQGNVTYLDTGVSIDDYAYVANNTPHLDPAREHNMINVLDNMRPVGALMTVDLTTQHFVPISVTPKVSASSTNFALIRYVTGAVTVNWPPVDATTGDRSNAYWVLPGVETEQVHFPVVNRSHPVIYQTIDNVHAYTDKALFDPTYGTPDFYGGNIPRYPKYRSEHIGPTQGDFSLIFPFVQSAPKDDLFAAFKAVSQQATPLILEGKSK